MAHERACRLCGCTQDHACYDEERGACAWASADVCTHCAGTAKYLADRLDSTVPLALALDVPHIGIAVNHAEQLARIFAHFDLVPARG